MCEAGVTRETPLILLPGMGADDRLFRFQREAFPHLVVPPWIEPRRRESIEGYAERMTAAVDPGRPCVVGGASFGGFVAVEMLRHLRPLACILIGSAESPNGLSRAIRLTRAAAAAAPLARVVPFGSMAAVANALAVAAGPLVRPATRSVFRQLAGADGSFLRWASEAVLRWRGSASVPTGTRVYQIHGGRDRVLPVKFSGADEVVGRGGHVISLSHPAAVNDFIRRCLADVLAHDRPPAYDSERLVRPLN